MSHPHLIAVSTGVPAHVVSQADVRDLVARLFADTLADNTRLLDVFENAEIDSRHLCVPLAWLAQTHSFAEKNDRYVTDAVDLACEVASDALAQARLHARDIDHLVMVSSTGIATPSLDARVANRLGTRVDMRRTPIWGLGCAGGAAGLARAFDFARADPGARVLTVAVELCSATFQPGDASKRNLVAASLFGDGAAAALVTGFAARAPRDTARMELIATRSILWPDTLDVMGWTVDGDGLHVVFSRDIPDIVRKHVPDSVAAFLDTHGLALRDVRHLVAHPGGVKVLRAYADALKLPDDTFVHARDVLRRFGNMSAPSCLFVLKRFLDTGEIGGGEHALIAALGPGFSAEYVLARGLA